MSKLPEAYINQMKRLLGEAGFFAYEKALEQSAERALRINLLRCPNTAFCLYNICLYSFFSQIPP